MAGLGANRTPPEMLDRADLEPVFFAPFVSSLMRVEPQWIDYNGHLNMAYYNVLFDRAVDEVYELIGIGAEYLKNHKHSTFTAEVHVRYVRELREDDPVRVTFQLLDYDLKANPLFRTTFPRNRGLGISNVGEHDAACRYDSEESLTVSCWDHAHARAHESSACATATAGSRGPTHRDAAEGLDLLFSCELGGVVAHAGVDERSSRCGLRNDAGFDE